MTVKELYYLLENAMQQGFADVEVLISNTAICDGYPESIYAASMVTEDDFDEDEIAMGVAEDAGMGNFVITY